MEIKRTQEEILARLKEAETRPSYLLVRSEHDVLLPRLEFEFAKEYLVDGTTKEQWDTSRQNLSLFSECYVVLTRLISGLEAGERSFRDTCKLIEFAWLTGNDKLVREICDASWHYGGVAAIKAFAIGIGEGSESLADEWEFVSDEVKNQEAAVRRQMARK